MEKYQPEDRAKCTGQPSEILGSEFEITPQN
jgi:hypothetical protein